MTQLQHSDSITYQGQFGEFTITAGDRRGVIIYRTGLLVAALCFAIGSGLVLQQGQNLGVLQGLTLLYAGFWLALGVSLMTIHIYLEPLHRLLQVFWAIGGVTSAVLAWLHPEALALYVYEHPLALLGVGWTFAAVTGIFFKEAFCFDRLETKLLTPLVPLLLLGHLAGLLPVQWAQGLLGFWAILFIVFAARKLFQDIPADIGDKSVFDYLRSQRRARA